MPAAYMPSSRFASARRPAPLCHSSKGRPISNARFSTRGNDVETMSLGIFTWRASSDSLWFPLLVIVAATSHFFYVALFLPLQPFDFVSNLHYPPRERRQRMGRCIRIIERPSQNDPHPL